MQEKSVGQVKLFIRDQITGRHMFNSEALLALGINPTEARARGFQIGLTESAFHTEKQCARATPLPHPDKKFPPGQG
jgi:hypothetical protein